MHQEIIDKKQDEAVTRFKLLKEPTIDDWSKLYMENKDKISNAEDYLDNLNRRYFKLSLDITCAPELDNNCGVSKDCLAYYDPKWRRWHNDPKRKHGGITLNLLALFRYKEEYIFEVMRHELAHAICDMRYGKGGHGPTWIKIAKLMRVDTKRYEEELNKHNNTNCCPH